ncbi:MAG: zinc-ribbon domain-containing protein [Butyrivibrio sp.]|nr:zinc-ribbon domain-containing protein [Butyrivibrio sp.]
MKICANCGNQVPDDAVFCNNCGSSLASDSAAPAPEVNAAAPNQEAAPMQQQPAPAPVPGPQPGAQGPQPGMQQNFQGAYQQAPNGQMPNGQMPYQQPYPQYQAVDVSDHTADFDAKDIADNKLFAMLPYFFGCLSGVLAGIYIKDSEFIKFHTKNTIRLAIAEILCLIVMIIPFIGWMIGGILLVVMGVVRIIGMVYVCQGKAKDLPIVGSIGFLK